MTRARSYTKEPRLQRGRYVKDAQPTHKLPGVNVMRLSEKGVLLELAADVEMWIPKSQIIGPPPTKLGIQDLEVTAWIAKEKGLIQ